MSVKAVYENIKANRAHVQKSLEKERGNLSQIQNSYRELLSKKDELSKHSSKLVKPLLRKISRKIGQFKLKLSKSSNAIGNLELELAELDKKIALLSEDISFYVQEQTDYMVTKLLDYVSNKSSNLAYNIETNFCIFDDTKRVQHKLNHHYYDVPTGNLAINQDSTLIVMSRDFYFDRSTYTSNALAVANYTDWFKEYLTTFKSTLKSKIENAFKGNKDFKVIFQSDSRFTLELI